MTSTAATATVAQIAARKGVSEPTVRRAIALGGVEPVRRGHYPSEAVEAAMREHCNVDMIRGHATSGRGNVEAAQFDALDPIDPLEGLDGANLPAPTPAGAAPVSTFGTLASIKRDGARLAVEKQQFDLDVKRGKMVSRESVERVAADIARRAAFHFLALAERATPRVMGKTDPVEVAAILEEEARRSLAELSSLGQLADEVLGLS